MNITAKDLIENEKVWNIKVTKGTKAIPNGEYELYSKTVKVIKTISFKSAFEFLKKDKAEIVIK